MALTHPTPYVVPPTFAHAHNNTVIALHGTSQSGFTFADAFLSYQFTYYGSRQTLPTFLPTTKFVFPTGLPKPTTVFGGQVTSAWFDVSDFSDRTIGEQNSRAGLQESVLYLSALIHEEVRLLGGRGKVSLLGFSQGCAIGVMLLLSGELERLGLMPFIEGFVGMSGWLPFCSQMEGLMSEPVDYYPKERVQRMKIRGFVRYVLGLQDMSEGELEQVFPAKVWLSHGELDLKMKMEWGMQMRDLLSALGVLPEWKSYSQLQHWWCEEEVEDIAGFLKPQ